MEIHVLIDDVKDLGEFDHIARTAPEGRRILQEYPVTHLYLDNDLGADQDMEGYDILVWARDNDIVPPNVQIVSMNNVAVKRMEALLEHDLGYVYNRSNNMWSKP